jgi:hypothetical protein
MCLFTYKTHLADSGKTKNIGQGQKRGAIFNWPEISTTLLIEARTQLRPCFIAAVAILTNATDSAVA